MSGPPTRHRGTLGDMLPADAHPLRKGRSSPAHRTDDDEFAYLEAASRPQRGLAYKSKPSGVQIGIQVKNVNDAVQEALDNVEHSFDEIIEEVKHAEEQQQQLTLAQTSLKEEAAKAFDDAIASLTELLQSRKAEVLGSLDSHAEVALASIESFIEDRHNVLDEMQVVTADIEETRQEDSIAFLSSWEELRDKAVAVSHPHAAPEMTPPASVLFDVLASLPEKVGKLVSMDHVMSTGKGKAAVNAGPAKTLFDRHQQEMKKRKELSLAGREERKKAGEKERQEHTKQQPTQLREIFSQSNAHVMDRLYTEAQIRKDKHEQAVKLKHDAELAAATFKPKLDRNSRKLISDADGEADSSSQAFNRLIQPFDRQTLQKEYKTRADSAAAHNGDVKHWIKGTNHKSELMLNRHVFQAKYAASERTVTITVPRPGKVGSAGFASGPKHYVTHQPSGPVVVYKGVDYPVVWLLPEHGGSKARGPVSFVRVDPTGKGVVKLADGSVFEHIRLAAILRKAVVEVEWGDTVGAGNPGGPEDPTVMFAGSRYTVKWEKLAGEKSPAKKHHRESLGTMGHKKSGRNTDTDNTDASAATWAMKRAEGQSATESAVAAAAAGGGGVTNFENVELTFAAINHQIVELSDGSVFQNPTVSAAKYARKEVGGRADDVFDHLYGDSLKRKDAEKRMQDQLTKEAKEQAPMLVARNSISPRSRSLYHRGGAAAAAREDYFSSPPSGSGVSGSPGALPHSGLAGPLHSRPGIRGNEFSEDFFAEDVAFENGGVRHHGGGGVSHDGSPGGVLEEREMRGKSSRRRNTMFGTYTKEEVAAAQGSMQAPQSAAAAARAAKPAAKPSGSFKTGQGDRALQHKSGGSAGGAGGQGRSASQQSGGGMREGGGSAGGAVTSRLADKRNGGERGGGGGGGGGSERGRQGDATPPQYRTGGDPRGGGGGGGRDDPSAWVQSETLSPPSEANASPAMQQQQQQQQEQQQEQEQEQEQYNADELEDQQQQQQQQQQQTPRSEEEASAQSVEPDAAASPAKLGKSLMSGIPEEALLPEAGFGGSRGTTPTTQPAPSSSATTNPFADPSYGAGGGGEGGAGGGGGGAPGPRTQRGASLNVDNPFVDLIADTGGEAATADAASSNGTSPPAASGQAPGVAAAGEEAASAPGGTELALPSEPASSSSPEKKATGAKKKWGLGGAMSFFRSPSSSLTGSSPSTPAPNPFDSNGAAAAPAPSDGKLQDPVSDAAAQQRQSRGMERTSNDRVEQIRERRRQQEADKAKQASSPFGNSSAGGDSAPAAEAAAPAAEAAVPAAEAAAPASEAASPAAAVAGAPPAADWQKERAAEWMKNQPSPTLAEAAEAAGGTAPVAETASEGAPPAEVNEAEASPAISWQPKHRDTHSDPSTSSDDDASAAETGTKNAGDNHDDAAWLDHDEKRHDDTF